MVGHTIEGIEPGRGNGRILGYSYDSCTDLTTISPYDSSFEIVLSGEHHFTHNNIA